MNCNEISRTLIYKTNKPFLYNKVFVLYIMICIFKYCFIEILSKQQIKNF